MKILMAGLGSIGQRHARNLRALLGDALELSAFRVRRSRQVITPDMAVEPGADVEAKYDIKVYTDLDEALGARPDAVFVTNPNTLHMPVALAAARAGCHLFIDKPLSHDLEGVQALTELVEQKGLVCLVGYQLRFHPGLKRVQSLLRTGAIGTVLAAHLEFGEYLPAWHPYEDYRQYNAARKDQGGGAILTQIHDLDYAYALFGMPRRVFALGGHLTHLEVDVEDVASILMECHVDGGLVPVHVHQDYIQRPPVRTCEILGENGKIVWDYNQKTVGVRRADQAAPEVHSFADLDRNQLFLDVAKHFLACVARTETPVVGVRDGANSLRIALAAKRSLETGTVVELADFRVSDSLGTQKEQTSG